MRALMAAGILAGEEGDRAVARERFVEALALADETGDAFWRNRLVANLGTLALFEGDHEEAIGRYETALAAAEDDWVRSLMLAQPRERLRGRSGAATARSSCSTRASRSPGPSPTRSTCPRPCARWPACCCRRSASRRARSPCCARAWRSPATSTSARGSSSAWRRSRASAARREEAVTGALLLGAAEATREAAGAVRQPDEMPWILEATTALRAALGEAAFAAAIARGRELPTADAVTRGLELCP